MTSIFRKARMSKKPLLRLAQGLGSQSETREGAWRFLRRFCTKTELAEGDSIGGKLTPGYWQGTVNRNHKAAMEARYMRHGLAACKRFGLECRDRLDLQEIDVELPVKVVCAVRRQVGVKYPYPLIVTRSDIPPRLEGKMSFHNRWRTTASTRKVRVGYEWIMREPELRVKVVAARLRGVTTRG